MSAFYYKDNVSADNPVVCRFEFAGELMRGQTPHSLLNLSNCSSSGTNVGSAPSFYSSSKFKLTHDQHPQEVAKVTKIQ
jgi:hypothetical protein